MKNLTCDIALGGSTSQWLDYNRRNLGRGQFVNATVKALQHRALTIPSKQAKRAACLIGLIYDKFEGDEYLLDVVCEAIAKLGR